MTSTSPRTISVKRFIEAPARDVWRVYTELEGWTYWASVGKVTLERPGDAERNGVGAIRSIAAPGVTIREQITAFDPYERLAYHVLSGAPTRDHRGEVVFDERPHGTVVRWRVSFVPRFPGTGRLMALGARVTLNHILGRLENRMAPLGKHKSECPYADSQNGKIPGLRLPGRAAFQRALLQAKMGG